MVSNNEIRILSLWPCEGDENAPIRCSFRVAKLVDHPMYEALSYVWGDTSNQLPICVSGGKTVNVTSNLHAALCQLRLRDKERFLWIDQLCINQQDDTEKIAQIKLMREIYSGCSCCIFWMGELRPDITTVEAKRTVELLQYLGRAGRASDPDSVPAPSWLDSFADFEGSMKALQSIVPSNNNWWTRAWTLQEAILPVNSIFQMGYLALPWGLVMDALETWVTKMPQVLNDSLIEPHLTTLNHLRSNTYWLALAREQQDPLLHGAFKWRSRMATLPHDNIIALMGLWPPETLPLSAACGYDMPADEVFCAFTADMIIHTQGLQPLMFDPRLEDDAATPNIPRWTIDMLQRTRKGSFEWRHIFCYDWYSADGGRQLDLELLQKTWVENPRILGLRGILADEIERVEPGLTWEGPVVQRPDKQLLQQLRVWADAAGVRKDKGGCRYYPGCVYTRHEAFGRLMLGDLVTEHQQLPQAWASNEDVEAAWSWAESGEQSRLWRDDLSYMPMNQSLFVTRKGRIGLGHWETKPGDQVWILFGGRVPFILRTRADGKDPGYDFVGWCYVQGIMRGELFAKGSEIAPKQVVHIY